MIDPMTQVSPSDHTWSQSSQFISIRLGRVRVRVRFIKAIWIYKSTIDRKS